MTFEILVPTYDHDIEPLVATDRLASLHGATIGIVSNGKVGTATFFDAMERELREIHGVATVVRTTKANYSAPAVAETMTAAQRWHALIAGIGD